ncbi:myeloperoxidase-like [Ambystoma mexicanum]|uniref:myeloperoxidase-like n=1 Tax=Ambystoma mexicanum TaxID=8296 RepID=UPI0037E8B4E4
MRGVCAPVWTLFVIGQLHAAGSSTSADDERYVQLILSSAQGAKVAVDNAFTQTRSNFKQALLSRNFSPFDLMEYFRQASGHSRNALRAAEKREDILYRMGIMLEATKHEHFNLTDLSLYDSPTPTGTETPSQ